MLDEPLPGDWEDPNHPRTDWLREVNLCLGVAVVIGRKVLAAERVNPGCAVLAHLDLQAGYPLGRTD